MQALIKLIDKLNEWIGRAVAWLMLAMVLVMCAVVLLRYGFGIGSIKLQESVTWMHGLGFMLGAAYALKHDAHVRVDVLYARWSPRRRAWVDLLGSLLLLWPVALLLLAASWPYVLSSWRTLEASSQVGGLPGLFLFKSAIPLAAVLLLLQGLAQGLKALAVIRGTADGEG